MHEGTATQPRLFSMSADVSSDLHQPELLISSVEVSINSLVHETTAMQLRLFSVPTLTSTFQGSRYGESKFHSIAAALLFLRAVQPRAPDHENRGPANKLDA